MLIRRGAGGVRRRVIYIRLLDGGESELYMYRHHSQISSNCRSYVCAGTTVRYLVTTGAMCVHASQSDI